MIIKRKKCKKLKKYIPLIKAVIPYELVVDNLNQYSGGIII